LQVTTATFGIGPTHALAQGTPEVVGVRTMVESTMAS